MNRQRLLGSYGCVSCNEVLSVQEDGIIEDVKSYDIMLFNCQRICNLTSNQLEIGLYEGICHAMVSIINIIYLNSLKILL